MSKDDDKDKATPFWALLEKVTRVADEDVDEKIWQQYHRIRLRNGYSAARAYGVGYEWIFEPNKVDIEWPPAAVQTRYKGKHFWYGTDRLFKGISWKDVEPVVSKGGSASGVTVEEDNYLERVTRVQENVLENANGKLPSLAEMEGIYGIVYYAAEYKYLLRHHRTTRGTFTFTCVPGDDENDKHVLQGTVEMDATVSRDLDIIPFGGNFAFVETDRYQRVVTPKHAGNTSRSSSVHSKPTVAGVIQIQVTQAPPGTFEMRYGRVTPNVFKGEFKQLKRRIALGLQRDCPMPWGEDDPPRRIITERNLEDCLQENKRRKETCLLWLRNHVHSTLPIEVLYRIQEYVSPPPFLILEEEDWVLGVVWSGGLPSYSGNSCLVVRKRK